MKLRSIQSLAIILWGIHANLVWFALPMVIIWEARFLLNRRWALTKQDFYRVADLTTLGLVAIIIYLFLNRTEFHFITTLLAWLPILFFPLVSVLAYSTTDRMPLDVLFYSLRRQKAPVTQSWDMDYLLFGLCLVSAGTNVEASSYYFPVAAILIFLALRPLRSTRYQGNLWVLLACVVFLAGFFTHSGIRETHLELKKRSQAWLANWIQQRTNPLRTQTAIGHVGRLKSSDAILFRVEAPVGSEVPALLQEASYDLHSANSWTVMNPAFSTVEPTDDFLWDLKTPTTMDKGINIYLEFRQDNAIIPLPLGVTRINQLPAAEIKQNYYGAIQGIAMVPSAGYEVKFRPTENLNGPPLPTDTFIRDQSLIANIVASNGMSAADPLGSLERFYRDFRYSLYQEETGMIDPIENFLLHRKAGHCEFFATTTVLLLRQMGIPARYVVGYSVQEFDSMLGMFVVRQRHAHAWAIAFLDNRWQVVDTTPSIWLAEEADQATLLQPVIDFLANSGFLFSIWWNKQKIEDYQLHLFLAGLFLALILAWRIYHSEQVILVAKEEARKNGQSVPGSESPIFALVSSLNALGYERMPAETLGRWFQKIGMARLLPLVGLHNRWRFDPQGINKAQQEELEKAVQKQIALIEAQAAEHQDVGKTS